MGSRPVLVGSTIALTFALVACPADKPRPAASGSPPSATVSPTASPSLSRRATSERARSLWLLYELVRVGDSHSSSLGLYRRQLSDGRTVRTGLSATGKTAYTASQNGRWLAWARTTDASSSSLFVARSEKLGSATRLARTNYIPSVLFRNDASMFYIDAPLSDPPPPNGTERLYSVGLDGRGRRLIATFEWGGDYLYRELLGFDERRDELIWTSETHDGAGGFFGLSATNVATGKTRSIMPRRTFFAYNQIAITADATRLYYVKDKIRLVERDLVAGSERTIYRADGASERVLEFVNVTANGSFVVFQAAEESVFSTGDQKQTITTYRIRLRDLARRTLRVDSVRPEDRVIPGLSPDGRYLFLISFSSERGRDLVVDLATGRTATLADRTKDRAARLVAWLWLPD